MPAKFTIGRLSTRTIQAFERRKRRDSSRYNRMTERQLDEEMRKLPVRPPIWRKLNLDQRAFLLLGAKHQRFAIFADTGVGKTLFSFAMMRYAIEANEARRFLILVPNKSNCYEWVDQEEEHNAGLNIQVLEGSTEDKWLQVERNYDADAYVTTYTGFMRMCCTLKSDKRRKAKKGKERLVPNLSRVKKWIAHVDGLFADESSFLKTNGSLPYRLARKLSKHLPYIFPLTGTPMNRDPVDLWTQIQMVDDGYTLGETMQIFKQTFYEEKKAGWGGTVWKFDKTKQGMLNRFLDHSSITVEANQADLPQVNPLIKTAYMEDDAAAYIEKAKQQIRTAAGNKAEIENIFLRMRQISSGFIGYKDDVTGDKASYTFPENPKLEQLETFIQSIDTKRYKTIIYHDFNYSAGVISEMLTRNKIDHALINGMRKDVKEQKARFNKDPKCRVLVLANSAGGYGLNLQMARYGLYYEAPVSALLRKQTERRFIRQYSKHQKVFLVDFITKGTSDEAILAFHKDARSLWKGILKLGEGSKEARKKMAA